MQSAYRNNHSTETALLKVQNDIMWTIDRGDDIILCLLDLSAAFDTIDHNILINRLERRFGIKDNALSWLTSYLQARSQRVTINSTTSPSKSLSTGVPQGSVLGPILFTLYMSPLGDLIRENGCHYTCYADDTQLYINIGKDDTTAITQLTTCLDSIREWMAANMLKLNENKTEILYIQSRFKKPQVSATDINIGGSTVKFSKSVRNLGVIFDEHMTMEAHIAHISKSAYAVIRKISHLRKFLNKSTTEKLVHAFLTSRLDYCNSLLYGVTEKSLNHVQRFQNTAARIITKKRKYDHITPIFISLHWLPVRQRISYKILLITYKILNNLAPPYLSDVINIPNPTRSLRSNDALLLKKPKIKTQNYGGRTLAFAAASLWNSLHISTRTCKNYTAFKKRIKTELFKEAFNL